MYRIGIDLGGTNIAAGVVDESQHIVAEVSVPTGAERGAEAVVADICRAAELAMAKAGKRNGYLLEGMACPGGCVAGAGTIRPVRESAMNVTQFKQRAKLQSAMETPFAAKLQDVEE